MLKYTNHIIVDDVSSWPSSVLTLIDQSKVELEKYLPEANRLRKLHQRDLSKRFKNPIIPYREAWYNTIIQIEDILENEKIIALHCTKLLDYEIKQIHVNGLVPLSPGFATTKIKTAFKKGFISSKLKNQLINKPELSEDERINKIFVFFCLSTLKDKMGLYKLFNYWGGEAIYSYMNDKSELKAIGKPCIIICSVNISDLEIIPSLGEHMLHVQFNTDRYPEPESSFNNTIEVLDIIEKDDEIFNSLTNFDKWEK